MYSCIPVPLVIEASPFLHLHKAPGCPATILSLRIALLLRLIESCASISAADGDEENASGHLEESLEVAVMLLCIKIESPGLFDAMSS
jgi:site-specific recombinase